EKHVGPDAGAVVKRETLNIEQYPFQAFRLPSTFFTFSQYYSLAREVLQWETGNFFQKRG
ncbi:MAG: hypothetical protein II736_00705, partial [Clostridia bacterium]|nr:hypothetical protein [Clostridia bacterium]